jgi:hypothetical protein
MKIQGDIQKSRLITDVNDTGDKMEKNLRQQVFSCFVEMLLDCCSYTHIMIFYFMFILRCRQTDAFATISSPVWTPVINQYFRKTENSCPTPLK